MSRRIKHEARLLHHSKMVYDGKRLNIGRDVSHHIAKMQKKDMLFAENKEKNRLILGNARYTNRKII